MRFAGSAKQRLVTLFCKESINPQTLTRNRRQILPVGGTQARTGPSARSDGADLKVPRSSFTAKHRHTTVAEGAVFLMAQMRTVPSLPPLFAIGLHTHTHVLAMHVCTPYQHAAWSR